MISDIINIYIFTYKFQIKSSLFYLKEYNLELIFENLAKKKLLINIKKKRFNLSQNNHNSKMNNLKYRFWKKMNQFKVNFFH